MISPDVTFWGLIVLVSLQIILAFLFIRNEAKIKRLRQARKRDGTVGSVSDLYRWQVHVRKDYP